MARPSPVLAVDDGYFPPSYKAGAGRTVLAGILYSAGPLDLLVDTVVVDGMDATEKTLRMCIDADAGLVLLDNVIYAGFNYVDAAKLLEECGAPVVVVVKHKLNPVAIRGALKKHFPDWEERWAAISGPVTGNVGVETRRGLLRIYATGINVDTAARILSSLQVYSRIPEPLRIADMAASAISRELLKMGLL